MNRGEHNDIAIRAIAVLAARLYMYNEIQLGACNRCGGAHDTQQCRFRNKVCRFCRKWGHIEKACCAKKRAEGTGVGKGVPTRDHSVKELKGDDESEELRMGQTAMGITTWPSRRQEK